MAITSKKVNPNAAVIVWNYNDRITSDGADSQHSIEKVIISSTSVISINTSKSKSEPAGQFEIRLAPSYNWVARLTPGSWLAILMCQGKIIPALSNSDVGQADERTLKMFGRIDSVRVVVDTDQTTGAKRTSYIVTGYDWGSIFNSILYIDLIFRNSILEGAIGQAARLLLDSIAVDIAKNGVKLPTPDQTIDAIIKLWGASLTNLNSLVKNLTTDSPIELSKNFAISSQSAYKFPQEVSKYMKMGLVGTQNFADVLNVVNGRLLFNDLYSGDRKTSYGIPDPSKFYGEHTFWQLLKDNHNNTLNELLTDIRWEDGLPKLTLYNRTKPFANRSDFEGVQYPHVQNNISLFRYVKKVKIPTEDVISINAGTNWRDKINFIEMRFGYQLEQSAYSAQIKYDSQVADRKAYEREGFKPLIETSNYFPIDIIKGDASPISLTQWKYLLKEWYFNTHVMLNGAVSIVGQNNYIQVGDNILIEAKVLGRAPFNSGQDSNSFLLAHVESVDHSFTVDDNGSRSFTTSIRFVRGVITDGDGKVVGDGSGLFSLNGKKPNTAIDKKANKLSAADTRNTNVIGNSTINDPYGKK